MSKEIILLTTILIVLTSCNKAQHKETNKSFDAVTTQIDGTQNKDFETNKVETVETDLGIGLVSIKFDDKTTLHFYSTPNDQVPKRTIQFFNDRAINSWNIRDLDKHRAWLNPEVLSLDYSQFVFRCLTIEDYWLKVMVNNETGESLWLKKNELTTFSDWEGYLKGMFGVARLPNQQQKIKSLPTEHSEEIIYQGQDCFQVKSMKGDWIEIFTADYCDETYTDSKTKIKSGWIKWRQGNRLLIEYFTTN